MTDDQIPDYDLEAVYDEQISPLMTQIIEICKTHKMPMLASFQYKKDAEEGARACTTVLINDAKFMPASSRLREAANALRRSAHVTLAETVVTKPDGSKEITIRRVT